MDAKGGPKLGARVTGYALLSGALSDAVDFHLHVEERWRGSLGKKVPASYLTSLDEDTFQVSLALAPISWSSR